MKAAVLVLAALLSGCGGAAAGWLEQLRAAHAEADALVLAAAPEKAAQALDRARALPPPSGIAAADRRAVLMDLDGRRALFALDAGNGKLAAQLATDGLSLGEGKDALTAALFILRGRAHEALRQDAEAVRDYEAAQAIDEALLDRLLTNKP